MRLCYIATPHSIHTQRWLRYFTSRDYQVYLIGVSLKQEKLPANAFSSEVIYYDLMKGFNVSKLRYLVWSIMARGIVNKIQPDILHAHQVAGQGWIGAAARYHPFIVTAWGSDLLVGPKRSLIQKYLAGWVLQQADYITCVSQDLARTARSLGADPSRIMVAPWGIDTDIFYPVSRVEKDRLKSQLGINSFPLVLSIRGIRQIYNPLNIAHAIPVVLKHVPDAVFIIRTYNCDRALLEEFHAIVKEHQAENRVRYIGNLVTEMAVADLYRAADVVISVPSSDGTPSSVLEALACGAVPVLSDVPSLHEWVQDEKEGIFVPVGDVAAISSAAVRLLMDSSLRDRLSYNGVRLIRQRADAKVRMHDVEQMYLQVMG